MIPAGLLLVGVLAMTATFSSVSADAKPVHKSAGSYTVAPPVLSGPPTTENGVTFIAGTVDVTTIGAQTGVAAVDFSCPQGTGARGVNECKGSFLFDGTIHGNTGTYRADMFDWIAGSEDAFTSAKFQMVRGSGTGGFSNLITIGGDHLRDEAGGTITIEKLVAELNLRATSK